MDRFLQLHLLTAYPPANLNRDDLNRPKTAVFGNHPRLRVSSQSLKRAWRTSDAFQEALAGHVGIRTKRMGNRVFEGLVSRGVHPSDALCWAWSVAQQFGKTNTSQKDLDKAAKKPDEADIDELLHIEQLAHFGPLELAAIDRLIETLADRQDGPREEELELLRKKPGAADVALFGRMVAARPRFNQEAAAQIAHAISVNAVQVEDDYFTAVDDLNPREEDMGAGHVGEIEFGAGVFYLYACIDRGLLFENLDGDEELARNAVRALTETACTVAPRGKQATFASRAYASFVLAEAGDRQPRTLAAAFLDPVRTNPVLGEATRRLVGDDHEPGIVQRMDQVYGPCAADRFLMDVTKGEGTLKGLLDFVGELSA